MKSKFRQAPLAVVQGQRGSWCHLIGPVLQRKACKQILESPGIPKVKLVDYSKERGPPKNCLAMTNPLSGLTDYFHFGSGTKHFRHFQPGNVSQLATRGTRKPLLKICQMYATPEEMFVFFLKGGNANQGSRWVTFLRG